MKTGRRLLIAAAALAALDLGRRLFRQSRLFNPDRNPVKSWDPADYGIDPALVDEHWIPTKDGEKLHAWYCRAPQPKASGIFCHGNRANLTLSADIIPHLHRAGLSILFFDYRGFGKSSGRPTVAGVLSDAHTAARFHDTLRPQHLPSILYGFSLGGAVAAQVIRRHPFDGLILQSTFTSLTDLTRVLYPRAPMHLLAGRLFDTLSVIRKLEVPLLVLHGTQDEVAPCAMGHALHDACPGVKRIQPVEGGLHNDLWTRDPETLVSALSEFIHNLRDRVQRP